MYQACPRRHPARSGSPKRSLSWGPRHSRHSPRLALSLLRVVPSSFLAASTPPRPERGLFLAQGQRTVPAPVLRLPAQQLQRVLVCLARVRVPAEYVVVAELLHLHGAQPGLGNLCPRAPRRVSKGAAQAHARPAQRGRSRGSACAGVPTSPSSLGRSLICCRLNRSAKDQKGTTSSRGCVTQSWITTGIHPLADTWLIRMPHPCPVNTPQYFDCIIDCMALGKRSATSNPGVCLRCLNTSWRMPWE
mmetsp:Transcript_66366/g.209861  ORF Transcript_66366/g.209861 Transcript_66366/m.209861 type:complete len:247 (+) Transcript_66366:288-1028(+)